MNIQDAASPLSPDVFSGHTGKPCEGLLHTAGQPTRRCPYESQCLTSSFYKDFFADTYEQSVTVSRVEISSNLVIRGEQQVLSGDFQRTVIRKHLFEGRFPSLADSENCVTQSVVQELIALILETEAADEAAYVNNPRLSDLEDELSATAKEIANSEWSIDKTVDTIRRLFDESMRDSKKAVFPKTIVSDPHFVEIRRLLIAVMSSGLPCRNLADRGRLGRYLGYVDIRLSRDASPISFAVLVPPRSLRHDHRYRLINTELGSLFGGPPVYGTVYAMVDPSSGLGGSCSTAASLMAIANLADRGGRPQGHLDITIAASEPAEDVNRLSSDCVHFRSQRAFRSVGLDYAELKQSLAASVFNATGSVQTVSSKKLLLEIVRANIDTRCPVILFVDFRKLANKYRVISEAFGTSEFSPEHLGSDTAHVVLLIGYSHDLSEIVVHDPCVGPYLVVSTNDILAASASAAYRFDKNEPERSQYTFACVASKRIQRHLPDALRQLRNSDPFDSSFYTAIFDHDQPVAEALRPDDTRVDYEFTLLHRDDVFKWISADGRCIDSSISAHLSTAKDEFTQLEDEWYWAVAAVEASNDSQDRQFDTIQNSGFWLISAEATAERRVVEQLSGAPLDDEVFAGWRFRAKYLANQNITALARTRVRPHRSSRKVLDQTGMAINEAITEIQGASFCADLGPALLTSSSELPLDVLLSAHPVCSGVSEFEFYLLRRIDLCEMISADEIAAISGRRHGLTEWMQYDANVSKVYDFIVSRFAGHNKRNQVQHLSLTALATFFVGISSLDQCYTFGLNDETVDVSELSGRAIENAMRLAHRLWLTDVNGKETTNPSDLDGAECITRRLLRSPIVEIVLGLLLDVCSCLECSDPSSEQVIFQTAWEKKAAAVIGVLKNVVGRLNGSNAVNDEKRQENGISGPWGFAVEIEPGENRLLTDNATLDAFFEMIDRENLDDHIGLNLDIAHCILCGISPDSLAPHAHRIMNAHISDHPGMHTRDHVPGRWRDIENSSSLYFGYLRLLDFAATHPDRILPFSSRLSLELEACSTASWCDSGIAAIRRLLFNHRRLLKPADGDGVLGEGSFAE